MKNIFVLMRNTIDSAGVFQPHMVEIYATYKTAKNQCDTNNNILHKNNIPFEYEHFYVQERHLKG